MTAIKRYLQARMLETLKSNVANVVTHFRRGREVAAVLPVLSTFSEDQVSSLLSMKPDNVIKSVTYSSNEQAVIFTLSEPTFVSMTLLESPSGGSAADDSSKLVVEFSSPNIAKPFHVGHLRSTVVGQAVANLLSEQNAVTRINYLGDWGTQFGFVQKGLELLSVSEDELAARPVDTLYRAYVTSYNAPNGIDEARKLFSQLENEETTTTALWKKVKVLAMARLRTTYDELAIHFDEFACESNYRASKIQHVIKRLVDENIAYFDKDLLVTEIGGKKVPILRRDNTTLYITRDVAAALDRITKFACQRIVYVVDKSQSEHFANLADLMGRLGHENLVRFCPFGRIVGMSTRRGTSILLSDVLEESVVKMAEQQTRSKNTRSTDERTTKILGLTGLQLYILKHGRLRDFNFNWEHALTGSGDSGVKIQYTHCRLCSLEERFDFRPSFVCAVDHSSLGEQLVLPLVYEIARCEDVIAEAALRLEPSLIVAHVFKLCNLTSGALKKLTVKGEPEAVAQHRLLLFYKARTAIKRLMVILGLQPLSKM